MVVCLAPPGRERQPLDCFSVAVEDGEQGQQTLADRLFQACRQRKVRFTEAAVALDCASFMQHTVHSEFSDPKRIAATVRFDTEETLATDIAEMAVSFRVTSGGEDGANLDVFTAERAVLSDAILSLQSNGIDPVAVDPDVCCLARYLAAYAKTAALGDESILYGLLSDSRGYLVVVSGSGQVSVLRTFLMGSTQDRTGLLMREILVTTALADAHHPVKHLCVFDAADSLRIESLGEGTGLKVTTCDLSHLVAVKPADTAENLNAVDLALACGAALAPAEKVDTVNLRNDHLPYLGRKRQLQSAVRLLSLSVTILFLALGVWFHSQMIWVNKQREALRDKLEIDYVAVMPGETKMPTPMATAVAELDKALRRLRAEKQGTGASQGSVSGMLTLVFQGINACARETSLNISSIAISATSIVIAADTSSRQNTQKAVAAMREIMKKAGIIVGPERQHEEGPRDAFSITAEPAKPTKGA
jgi:hypothetical protein